MYLPIYVRTNLRKYVPKALQIPGRMNLWYTDQKKLNHEIVMKLIFYNSTIFTTFEVQEIESASATIVPSRWWLMYIYQSHVPTSPISHVPIPIEILMYYQSLILGNLPTYSFMRKMTCSIINKHLRKLSYF